MRLMFASSAIALAMAGPALAQTHDNSMAFVQMSETGDMFSSDLVGKSIYAASEMTGEATEAGTPSDMERIGEISDILLSQDGEVKAVLLDIGGFLGIGEKTVAVSMSELEFTRDDMDGDYTVVAATSRAALENAPGFEWAEPVDRSADGAMARPAATDADRPAWPTPSLEREGYAEVAVTEMTADELQGAPVYGISDERIGEIAELELGSEGEIRAVYIDVGGFLGIGETRISIDYDELQIMRGEGGMNDLRVYVSATQEQLEERAELNG